MVLQIKKIKEFLKDQEVRKDIINGERDLNVFYTFFLSLTLCVDNALMPSLIFDSTIHRLTS